MATFPIVPTMPPIEVDVEVSLNGDYITPVSFGSSITYEFPETFTTDKISEVVVAGTPMSFSRMQAIYGATSESSSTNTADGPEIADQSTSTTTSIQYNAAGPSSAWNTGQTGSVFYPNVDFFPRYGQWFANATWPYPFNPYAAKIPRFYDLYLVYIDRTSKKVYWRTAKANLVEVSLPSGLENVPRLNDTSANLSLSVPEKMTRFALNLLTLSNSRVDTWLAADLPSGLSLSGSTISGYVMHPSPGSVYQPGSATITATNEYGSTSALLRFSVSDPTLTPPALTFTGDVATKTNTTVPSPGTTEIKKVVVSTELAAGATLSSLTATLMSGGGPSVSVSVGTLGPTTEVTVSNILVPTFNRGEVTVNVLFTATDSYGRSTQQNVSLVTRLILPAA